MSSIRRIGMAALTTMLVAFALGASARSQEGVTIPQLQFSGAARVIDADTVEVGGRRFVEAEARSARRGMWALACTPALRY